jgi:S-layer homology domain
MTVTRAQMAVFLLRAREDEQYVPAPCTAAPFADVPCTNPFAPWIAELARRHITAGCGGGNYCPDGSVTREQMAVFLLRARESPAFEPAGCTAATFTDVPCSSGFAGWIYELVIRGVTAGCAPGRYCPSDPVTRAQMAVLLVRTFALPL